ncbi:MAG: ABC transporter permease [Roseovarius pacificus]|nr:ABC transporter permease [Roseovarius pacificus]
MHIIAFLIRRAIQAVIVMFVISIIGFSIQDNLGDPLRELVGQSVSEQEREALRDELGLNDPFFAQYTRFLGNALQGDLGTSYFFKRPALSVILDKFPATFELVLGAVFIFVSLSIPAGIYCAINRESCARAHHHDRLDRRHFGARLPYRHRDGLAVWRRTGLATRLRAWRYL